VFSKTHQDMPAAEWEALNSRWHHYFEQALALAILDKEGLIDIDNSVDYAAGYGTLAKFVKKHLGRDIDLYDPYITNASSEVHYITKPERHKYPLVINSAMFEHVMNRSALDEIDSLVSPSGVLMMHTLVCENVPKDANWFYLLAVHTAFHTNRSMAILMEEWGYAASLYSPQAKSWFCFKKDSPHLHRLEASVQRINDELQARWFYYKPGFVDYWKGF
jgi:hypothetical protein